MEIFFQICWLLNVLHTVMDLVESPQVVDPYTTL